MKQIVLTAALTAIVITGLCAFGGCKNTGSFQTATNPDGSEAPALVELNTNTGLISIAGQTINTNLEYETIESATSLGVALAISKDTNSIAYFRAADVILTAALANGQFDPKQLSATLKTISVNELKDSSSAQAGVQTGLILYQTFFGQIVSAKIADTSPYLGPGLAAIRDGIGVELPAASVTLDPTN